MDDLQEATRQIYFFSAFLFHVAKGRFYNKKGREFGLLPFFLLNFQIDNF